MYGALLADLDGRLGAAGDHGIIAMDGGGSDQAYQREHRKLKLATRGFIGSHISQPIQVADVLAYTAYQVVQRPPGKGFMVNWWT
ncbi:hypothetical protein [Streptomyces sp. NPDC059881]|uniref:hypothetical protein n=1 Tax=Streptomyces sp. NPDC059881 TaxID=3346986 RepID=UPI003654A77F